MKIKKFEEIIAWQKSQELAVTVYKTFDEMNDYGFKGQIQRAVVSISNNIAEGFDRFSDKEFIRFLYISQASCSEVKSMLYLSNKLGYLEKEKTYQLINETIEIGKIINGLIKSIKNSIRS